MVHIVLKEIINLQFTTQLLLIILWRRITKELFTIFKGKDLIVMSEELPM